jgi:hypothetical protein
VIAGIFFIAQYLQLVVGLSPLQAGLWTAPSSGEFIAGSILAPVVARRVRPAFVMAGGLALSAIGFGMLTQVSWPTESRLSRRSVDCSCLGGFAAAHAAPR